MKEYKEQFINDHTGRFNKNVLARFYPSEILYVYKIFSGWYGLGSYWINLGLLDYVKIDRKTYYGFKIYNTFCVRIMVMLKLKLAKGKCNKHV